MGSISHELIINQQRYLAATAHVKTPPNSWMPSRHRQRRKWKSSSSTNVRCRCSRSSWHSETRKQVAPVAPVAPWHRSKMGVS